MAPVLNDGEFVATTGSWLSRLFIRVLKPGRLIVVNHPRFQTIVKRVAKIDHHGRFLLEGENNSSLSTQQLGWLRKEDIFGIVVLKVK